MVNIIIYNYNLLYIYNYIYNANYFISGLAQACPKKAKLELSIFE